MKRIPHNDCFVGSGERRHKTRTTRYSNFDRQDKAAAEYKATRGPAARRQRAQERAEQRAKRNPASQLKRLNKRLGGGKGAERERARLKALIKAAKQTEQVEQAA